jgi:hypothetical protein
MGSSNVLPIAQPSLQSFIGTKDVDQTMMLFLNDKDLESFSLTSVYTNQLLINVFGRKKSNVINY